MKRLLALAIVGLMLAVPAASATSFMQPGNGPQRTGAIDHEGPQTNDTAFQLELPGIPLGAPAIVDGQVYMFTVSNEVLDRFGQAYDGDTEGFNETGLWRIDPHQATKEKVMAFPEDKIPLFSGGGIGPDRLLMQNPDNHTISAVEVPSGDGEWTAEILPGNPRDFRTLVTASVTIDGTLYAGFQKVGKEYDTPVGEGALAPRPIAGVVALDQQTGEELWTWTRTQADAPDTGLGAAETEGVPDEVVRSLSLSADDERVYVYMRLNEEAEAAGSGAEKQRFELAALSSAGGGFLWSANDTEEREAHAGTPMGSFYPMGGIGWTCCAYPLVTETQVAMRLDAFEAYNPATGGELWTSEAGSRDRYNVQGAKAMGARGDMLIGTSAQTVYRLDTESQGAIDWRETTTDQGYLAQAMILDRRTAYLNIAPDDDEDEFMDIGIEARDLETGEVRWRWTHYPDVGHDDPGFNNAPSTPVYGPGYALWGSKDGTVHVIGETEASLGEPGVPGEKYPGVGNETTIDASGAEPGAFGDATRYMVDWGDGTVSGWQEDPVFTHTYNESGEHRAQVYAGNDANQTSSTVVTMKVGEEAPAEPNWVAERFEKGNQDMTFGVIGVALAVGGGAVGVARRQRKRSNLEDEFETLETGFEEMNDQPSECEAFLDTRKARARSLALDGYLREDQVPVIENRAEELRGQLRTSALEEEFAFLPYGLVTKARQMVQDGDVTSLEKDAFLRAVEEDEVLTEEQKATVRERIQRWHGRDAGGGGER